MRFSYLVKPKLDRFRRHDLRLREAPDPAAAREKFEQRLREGRRVTAVRTACFVGLYLSAAIAAVAAILRRVPVAPTDALTQMLQIVAAISSSMTALFVIGIFVTTRVLGFIEVDLHFYSQESRMRGDA